MAKGRVGAFHGARPQPGNHGEGFVKQELLALVLQRFQHIYCLNLLYGKR